jgi:hypothetical protein
MRTRALATTLLALAVAVGWPATPAEAYGGTTTLTYNEQLTGYGATWRDPWDPYYEEYCYWWEEDPWWGWCCVAWYEWENFAHVSTALYTPSGTWVAGSGAAAAVGCGGTVHVRPTKSWQSQCPRRRHAHRIAGGAIGLAPLPAIAQALDGGPAPIAEHKPRAAERIGGEQ